MMQSLLFMAALALPALSQTNLTDGWKQVVYPYDIHKPHDLPLSDRYSYDAATNTHKLFVLRGDKSHNPSSNTAPRCELRFRNDYRDGERMFDADVFVVGGTHSSIYQIFGSTLSATTLMILSQADGRITYYDGPQLIRRNANNVWWNLKVYHNPAGEGQIKMYVDNVLALTVKGRGRTTYYNKCGVYSVRNGNRSETHWRNIKFWIPGKDSGASDIAPPLPRTPAGRTRFLRVDLGRPLAAFGAPGREAAIYSLTGARLVIDLRPVR